MPRSVPSSLDSTPWRRDRGWFEDSLERSIEGAIFSSSSFSSSLNFTSRSYHLLPDAPLTQWPHRVESFSLFGDPRGLDIHALRTIPPPGQMPLRNLTPCRGTGLVAADAEDPGRPLQD